LGEGVPGETRGGHNEKKKFAKKDKKMKEKSTMKKKFLTGKVDLNILSKKGTASGGKKGLTKEKRPARKAETKGDGCLVRKRRCVSRNCSKVREGRAGGEDKGEKGGGRKKSEIFQKGGGSPRRKGK